MSPDSSAFSTAEPAEVPRTSLTENGAAVHNDCKDCLRATILNLGEVKWPLGR